MTEKFKCKKGLIFQAYVYKLCTAPWIVDDVRRLIFISEISCKDKDCEECFCLKDEISDIIDDINTNHIQDGQLYRLGMENPIRNWETNIIENYNLIFLPYQACVDFGTDITNRGLEEAENPPPVKPARCDCPDNDMHEPSCQLSRPEVIFLTDDCEDILLWEQNRQNERDSIYVRVDVIKEIIDQSLNAEMSVALLEDLVSSKDVSNPSLEKSTEDEYDDFGRFPCEACSDLSDGQCHRCEDAFCESHLNKFKGSFYCNYCFHEEYQEETE